MAENKKGFVLYCDLIHTIKKMPDDKAGLLFKHLLAYVNDENPITDDLLIELTFEPIKQQLKRDLDKWEDEVIKRGDSGALGNLKRWNKDLYNNVINKELSLQKAIEIAKSRKASHPDKNHRTVSQSIANIAVTDTVTDTVTDIYKKENITEFALDDLENSSHLEIVCKRTELSLSRIKELIPEFKKIAALEYPTVLDLINHFIRWVNKNKTIIVIEKKYDPEAARLERLRSQKEYNDKMDINKL